MKPQGTLTERLKDVLQVLQLARKSGTLTVERALDNGLIERGLIILLNGQVTEVSMNGYQGQRAFDMLMGWQPCYFMFHLSPPTGPLTQPATPLPHYPTNTEPLSRNRNGQTPPPVTAPYRLYKVEDVLSQFPTMGLSRSHRQLFLLLDGQRTARDLARLVGRGLDDVEMLLVDLARAGLIHQ